MSRNTTVKDLGDAEELVRFALEAPMVSEEKILEQMRYDHNRNPHNDNYLNSHRLRSRLEIEINLRFEWAEEFLKQAKEKGYRKYSYAEVED